MSREDHLPFSMMPVEAFYDSRLTLTQIRVLGAILSFRNRNTNVVWPSREAIAARCGLLPTKVSTATTGLCSLGWVRKSGSGGRSSPCHYEVTTPEFLTAAVAVLIQESESKPRRKTVPDSGTVPESETVPESGTKTVPESGTKTVPESGTKTVPESGTGKEETKEETSEETKEENMSAAADASPPRVPLLDCEEVLEHLNRRTGGSFKAKTGGKPSKSIELIRQRMREHGKDALIGVIDRKAAEWMGDAKMEAYLRPSTLFGREKCEGYVGELSRPPRVRQREPQTVSERNAAVFDAWLAESPGANSHTIEGECSRA